MLTATLLSGDRVQRETAAQTLGEIGPSARTAAPALRRALEDEHSWVRGAAEQALKKVEPGATDAK